MSLRALGPIMLLARVLPIQTQWYLFSRLWVAAIRYLERVARQTGARADGKAGARPGGGKAGAGQSESKSRFRR